jgi:hypothetical protein
VPFIKRKAECVYFKLRGNLAILKYTVANVNLYIKMKKSTSPQSVILLSFFIFVIAAFLAFANKGGVEKYDKYEIDLPHVEAEEELKQEVVLKLDTDLYDQKMNQLANNPVITVSTSSATSTPVKKPLWPVTAAYPNYGALLPFNRIVAYYGNFYSKQMGVLGEYPEDVMLEKLAAEVKKWELADPTTPVIPAIHYIASTAQPTPGRNNNYTLQMPFSQIDKSLELAKKVDGIVFLDLQIGTGNLMSEVEEIGKYLALPQVHLGIDPEFAMKNGERPGTRIGTIDAKDVNQVAEYLAKIVRDNKLPPKILIVHRFTEAMVTNYQNIRPLPEVQIVIEMDGWGGEQLKKMTYRTVITREPVQFTGFKLFYKNDIRLPGSRMLTPEELMKLQPIPSYIQYQ